MLLIDRDTLLEVNGRELSWIDSLYKHSICEKLSRRQDTKPRPSDPFGLVLAMGHNGQKS